jgi:hypothetical protein
MLCEFERNLKMFKTQVRNGISSVVILPATQRSVIEYFTPQIIIQINYCTNFYESHQVIVVVTEGTQFESLHLKKNAGTLH